MKHLVKPEIYLRGSRPPRWRPFNWNVVAESALLTFLVTLICYAALQNHQLSKHRRTLAQAIDRAAEIACPEIYYYRQQEEHKIPIARRERDVLLHIGDHKELTVTVPAIDRTQMSALMVQFFVKDGHVDEKKLKELIGEAPELTMILTSRSR